MATADQLVVLNNKQSIGLVEMRERLFQIIDKWDSDVVKALWDEEGWFVGFGFNGPPTLSSSTIGKFRISTTIEKGTDGLGNLINLNKSESFVGPHDFENADGIDYHVGLMVARVPTVIKTSLETGIYEYTAETEIIGRKGPPLTVVDNGTTITFNVDTITEVSRSNAGRRVMVYLKVPQSGVEAVAIEVRTVYWNGTHNHIDTNALLGQVEGSASTAPSDYEVVLLGPRVSRDTNLSTLNEGTLYVGSMEGDAGAPVSVFDYSDGTTMIPIPDLWNVLRYGPNGDLKIEVKKHSSDSDEAQIAVKHTSGNYTFEVNGLGVVKIRDTGGTVVFHIDSNGNIQESGGLFKSTTSVIGLDDDNTSGPIPLSQAGQTALPTDLQAETIIGIAEAGNTKDLFSAMVLSGCELATSPSSFDVDFGAGAILYKGFKYDKAASVSSVVMPPSTTRYARYGISTTSFVLEATYPGDVDDDKIYVAKLTSDGSGVTEVVDLRAPAYRIDRRTEILVGDMEGGVYEAGIAHFPTVGAALKAIDVWANEATQKRGGPYTIRVIGKCEEDDTPLQLPIDGIEIVGSRARRGNPPYGPFIGWTDDTALFDLNGQDRAIFKDLHMLWGGGATPGGSGAPVRVCFVNTGGAVEGTRIKDCYAKFGDGFFYHVSANANDDVLIEHCTGKSLGTCGVVFHDTSGLSGKIRVLNCDFEHSGNDYDTNNYGISLRGWADAWICNGYVDNAPAHGIVVQSCGIKLHGCSSGAADDGILVRAGCTGVVSENGIVTVGGHGIACYSSGVRVVDNQINDVDADGVYLLGANEVLVKGNHLKNVTGVGINSAGDDNIIVENHVINPIGDGIEVGGARNQVGKNYIRKITGLAVDVTAAGDASSVDGNTIEGTTSGIATSSAAQHVSVRDNQMGGGNITVSGDFPVVNGNITRGGSIVLRNDATQKGTVLGNNLRLSAVAAGTITAHGQDDVGHNQL